jgi:hypothetical protein
VEEVTGIHRPYSMIRGSEPSVTTILEMLPKPGLPWGAAKETAMFAVLHPDRWQHLAEAEAVDVLRRHHRGIWDGRAAVGTLVHAVNEAYCDGEVVDLDKLIDQTIDTDRNARTWRDADRDDLTEQVLGYVLGLEKWWDQYRPTDVRSEVVVRCPGLYIGQTDLRCTIDGDDWLLDLKTTNKQDDGSGLYVDSWSLQLAMYGAARETVTYDTVDAPDIKRGFRVVEAGTGPWSRPQRYGVIHLRGDEEFTVYELPVTRAVERTAFRLARAYHGWKQIPDASKVTGQEAAA